MIRKKEQKKGRLEIDLTGSDGNAYVLLGYAKTFSKELGLDYDKISSEMKSGNYENLVAVFDKYFGDYVILYR